MIEAIPTRVPEWTSRSESDFGIVLIELFAYLGDSLSFYIDRAANEAFLTTAVRRRSVLDIAKMLNYKPTEGSAAQVQVQIEASEVHGEVIVPARTRVSTTPRLSREEIVVFETDEELELNGQVEEERFGTVWATEGESHVREELGQKSNGQPNQRMAIPHSPVVGGSIEVWVDEGGGFTLWREIDNLLYVGNQDAAYSIDVDEEEVAWIEFGDGVHGKIPLKNSTVEASNRVGGGLRGNVAEGTIDEFVDYVNGVVAVHNPVPANGGADPESTQEIRVNAPRALAAVNRAVSLPDHEAIALQVPGVARASADHTAPNEVTVYVVPFDGGFISPNLQERLEAYFGPRLIFSKTVVFSDATYVPIDIEIDVAIKPTYVKKSVESAVEDAIEHVLSFERSDLRDRVTQSSLYRALSAIPGVDLGVVRVLDREGLTGLDDVELDVHEFPQLGTLTLNTTGGIV